MPTNMSNSKGSKFTSIFGGCNFREGVIAHVVTLGADDSKKFLEFTQTKVIPSHDKQRIILMDNVPFHRSCENTTSF